MGLFTPIHHRSAADYHATCPKCDKKIEGFTEQEVQDKLDRHNKRSHNG